MVHSFQSMVSWSIAFGRVVRPNIMVEYKAGEDAQLIITGKQMKQQLPESHYVLYGYIHGLLLDPTS